MGNLMRFVERLQSASLVRRYKRFLAEVELPDGRFLTVHCPNTGSMVGCLTSGNSVLLSQATNPTRKYPYTLEMIQVDGFWVGVNTSRTNALVREALLQGVIEEFGQIEEVRAEVAVGAGSRLDFFLRTGKRRIYLEVKNCTLVENGVAMFPDAVTARGAKHLSALKRLRREGFEAAVLFCVQRGDAVSFSPATAIDPFYAETLVQVEQAGVTVLAYQAEVQPEGIAVVRRLPVVLGGRGEAGGGGNQ